jgi:hypothetical protein
MPTSVFSDAVNLSGSVPGYPGIVISFTPQSAVIGENGHGKTCLATITAASSVPPTTYTATITGTVGGVTATTTLAITVNPAGTSVLSIGDASWSPNPATLDVDGALVSGTVTPQFNPALLPTDSVKYNCVATQVWRANAEGSVLNFRPYKGNYIIAWPNNSTSLIPSFTANFFDPGDYIIQVCVTATISHNGQGTTTLSASGYIGGTESDVDGASGVGSPSYTGPSHSSVDVGNLIRMLVLPAVAATNPVGVHSIKYQAIHDGQPYGTGHTAPSVLYVLKGSSVLFHAIAGPVGATFPATGLVWSGSSGASGTASTTTVTFITVSASTTDYKTVTAKYNGSSVTVNVIVYTLTPSLVYGKEFGPSGIKHDPDRLGIGEVVNLSYTIAPSGIDLPDSMQWSDSQTSNIPQNVLLPPFTAPSLKGDDILSLTLESGPSAGSTVQLKQTVIEPTSIYQIPKVSPEKIYHDGIGTAAPAGAPLPSAGSLRWNCLLPINVSWANVQTSENDCKPAVATGTCSADAGTYHEQGTTSELITPLWHGYAYNPKDKAWESDQVDKVELLVHAVGEGEVLFNITMNVRTLSLPDWPINGILSMPQKMTEDSTGAVTLSKGGLTTVAPLTINSAYAPYVGPFPGMSNFRGPLPNDW